MGRTDLSLCLELPKKENGFPDLTERTVSHSSRVEDGEDCAVAGVAAICHGVLRDFPIALDYIDGEVEISG